MGSPTPWLCGLLLSLSLLVSVTSATPLDDYVNAPDDAYGYEELNTFRLDGATVYVLKLTSLTWLSEEIQSRSTWWHYLQVVVPDELSNQDVAFLWIDESDNTDLMPDENDLYVRLCASLAVPTGTIVADIKQVPNQPVNVYSEPNGSPIREDALVGWAWNQYIEHNPDPEFLIQLPMTKASVRAMDAVQDFVAKKINHKINEFVVGGASKRGWIAWLIAAVDKRVKAIVPVVLTCLDFVNNLHHHYRAMNGAWSFPIGPYYHYNLTRLIDEPRTREAFEIVDPFYYLERLKLPKYIIAAGNDEFFFPDDTYYFFNKLIGTSYFRMIPNAEHTMIGSVRNMIDGVRPFYRAILNGAKMPTLKWTREMSDSGGRIVLTTDTKPSRVQVWTVNSASRTRRDFRALKLGSPWNPDMVWPQNNLWDSQHLEPEKDGAYIAEFTSPRFGWFAFFIEVYYDAGNGEDYRFTSEVAILPDTFPAEDCHGEECYGKLV